MLEIYTVNVKIGATLMAHSFKKWAGILSGPVAFRGVQFI